MAKELKKKKSEAGMTTRERMMARKKKLAEKGNGSGFVFVKEGTMRVRLVSQGPDKEIGLEIIQFYDPKLGSVISPATFDEPCPIMEKFQELKKSSDEDDQALAKLITPRRRYLVGGTIYKDEKGKEVDPDGIRKAILVPRSVYQDIIDLYLDEDDWGDMTDPTDGYDIKISRSGSGKMDTTYSVTACPRGKTSLKPKYTEEVDLEDMVRKQLLSYDELEEKLDEFLNGAVQDEDDSEEEVPKKKKKVSKDKKKKSKHGDI